MFQLRTEISLGETSGGGGEGGGGGVSVVTNLKFVGAGSADCPIAATGCRMSHAHINPRLVTDGYFTILIVPVM
jgi:hypothetical protein